jgi:glycosyltransferase involved in cell wall biosynthesis
MRIVHVISGLETGGAETMLAKLLAETRGKVEYRVVSLTRDGPVGERIRGLGIGTAALGMKRGLPDPRGIMWLAREIRTFAPDLVQTWMHHADLVGGLAARLSGRPVVWGIRNAGTLAAARPRWTTRVAMQICARLSHRLPARIISCGEKARDIHLAAGYDKAKMVVIPNGFDLSSFAPRPAARLELRRELGVPEDAHLVGMVSRDHPAKDVRNFVRAAGLASRREPSSYFLLCGDGLTPDNGRLGTWLAEEGILPRTRLLGHRSDVPRVLAALDLFTLSSRSEGFPNAIGEAMACGIPCATTDAGDSREIIGDTGTVVPIEDAEALATAWLTLLALGRERRQALGTAARTRIEARFSMQAVARDYLRTWESSIRH